MIEVEDKRQELAALPQPQQHEFLAAHPIPAVRGPDDHVFLIDHHHLVRAAHDLGLHHVVVHLQDELELPAARFWSEMRVRQWAHPIDEH